jgi:hypothetical protein
MNKDLFNLKSISILVGLLMLIPTYNIVKIAIERDLIPLSVLALIAGLLFEGKSLYKKREIFLYVTLASFILSFIQFYINKDNNSSYLIGYSIRQWPYWFIGIFIIITISIHHNKIISRLTEGITLLQSIAVIYWAADLQIHEMNNFFVKFMVIIGLTFSVFTLFNALTSFELSRTSRLLLSIWSCIIMLLFAIDNILAIYELNPIEVTVDLSSGLYIALQHFLLGISIIYIIQNFTMIISFLPSKGAFFNSQYFSNIDELKEVHIERYSDQQVNFLHSIFCIGITTALFYLNFHFQFVPRNFAIWTLFVLFPILLNLFDLILKKKTESA